MKIRVLRRRGFTLIELLVVMSIIAMLAGLLLPAVNSVRETGRKTVCTNNIRNVAIALINHDSTRGMLPGWSNRQDARVMYTVSVPTLVPAVNTNNVGWVFPTLPYLERDDIFRAYSQPVADSTKVNSAGKPMYCREFPVEHIKILVCPNDSSAINNGINFSYVANCGLRERAPTEPKPSNAADGQGGHSGDRSPNGMFFNAVTSAQIARGTIGNATSGDGGSSTFLLAENMDAELWPRDWEGAGGFCWIDLATSPALDTAGVATTGPTMAPNHGPIGVNTSNLPRASSFHPGGFTVAFADSHTSFLSSGIAWDVYIRLFTPRGDSAVYLPTTAAVTTPTISTATIKVQNTPLSDTY